MREYNLIKENNEIKQQDPDAEFIKTFKIVKMIKFKFKNVKIW